MKNPIQMKNLFVQLLMHICNTSEMCPIGKVVDLEPCLTKKPAEDSACHAYNTRGSMSEVQSLSSFQSESCDDNGMLSFNMWDPTLLVTNKLALCENAP